MLHSANRGQTFQTVFCNVDHVVLNVMQIKQFRVYILILDARSEPILRHLPTDQVARRTHHLDSLSSPLILEEKYDDVFHEKETGFELFKDSLALG
jgi:hypothetical protein